MLYALISHDVDHISVKEHFFKDLIVEKFFIRSNIELFTNKISFKEYFNRIQDIMMLNKWNNIDNIIKFNNDVNIRSTFFVGVSNGKGLNYNLNLATWAIKLIVENNYDIGVHGINYNDFNKIYNEYNTFRELSNYSNLGIRMHYLRKDNNTIDYLHKSGYIYDASVSVNKNPYFISENFLEIPIHIMDGWMILDDKRYQKSTLEKAKELTKRKIDFLVEQNIEYISILFHDRYFSNSFITWKNWYEWLIEYLKKNSFIFITHKSLYYKYIDKV